MKTLNFPRLPRADEREKSGSITSGTDFFICSRKLHGFSLYAVDGKLALSLRRVGKAVRSGGQHTPAHR